MPLKDRLKLNSENISENITKNIAAEAAEKEVFAISEIKTPKIKTKSNTDELILEFLKQDINILVYCDINIPTYSAINYLCSKIESDKRLVGIGANLLLNPDEIIKFQPETKNQSKELIKTALSLKPYKIILQDFDGVEAVDIFKLVNAGIKNIITAVNAKTPENALSQIEMNLYMNGVQIPQNLMKSLISSFVDKIVFVEKLNGEFNIKNIYNVEFKDNQYEISEIFDKKEKNISKEKAQTKQEPLKIDIIETPKRRNILASKIKKKKISIK